MDKLGARGDSDNPASDRPEAETAESVEGNITDAVIVFSRDGTICSLLPGSQGTLDDTANTLPGCPVESLWTGELALMIRDNIKRALRSRQVCSEEFDDRDSQTHYEFIFVAQGQDRVMVVARDISRQKDALSEMQRLAYVDEVTGLPNREYLLKELARITESLRLTGGRAGLICIDVQSPALSGTAAGKSLQDAILMELGRRLTGGLRGVNQQDVLDEDRYSVVTRIDFRQFAVLLPEIESGEDVGAVAERIEKSLQQPVTKIGKESRVTVSAGISLFPQDGTDARTLLDNAIAAMEDAKSNPSVQHKFHSGTVKVRALKRQDLELELKAALDREELLLNFLPIVRASTGDVVTAESLLRWPQEVFGSRPIQEVVTLAEHTGLIVPIGEWVIRRSCEQLNVWHSAGHTSMKVAVNLSVQEFSRGDLVERIETILNVASVDPKYLELEITEHMLFRDAMRNFVTCNELKELGVSIVLDDYGTGACSLAHLSRSPIDAVKIDTSFVEHSEDSESARSACAAVTAMAHALGLEVVAEGVETEQQASFIRELGCDYLQGFLFCRPSPADEFAEYLQKASTAETS